MKNLKILWLWLLAAAMISVGIKHFTNPEPFVKIIPPIFPAKEALVYISGVFEILGGLGLLVPRTRRFAGLGLMALFIAVFPANIYMATNQVSIGDTPIASWILWSRLPLQFVLIFLAHWVSKENSEHA